MSNRYLRQKEIIPYEALEKVTATVVGVGAIGRQVALQLAAIGVPEIHLIDFDSVEEVNLAAQGFLEEDLGKDKVIAVAEQCGRINSLIRIHGHACRFRRDFFEEVGGAVFCCVDDMSARRLIWETVSKLPQFQFFADGRMSAETLRVLCATDLEAKEYYPTTLFSQEEAFVGSCTAKSTIFCANIAAGMMVEQFSKVLRRIPIESDVFLNLLAMELTVPKIEEAMA
jgi:sulfur carrier protein ThiS adenylyltransferase